MCNYLSIKFQGTLQSIPSIDEKQILMCLNSKQYSFRQSVDKEVQEELINIAIKETSTLPNFEENYPYNCHTLTRIANRKYGWEIIYGYAIPKKYAIPLRLKHHSVSKDSQGNLLELTPIFSIEYFDFMERPILDDFKNLEVY